MPLCLHEPMKNIEIDQIADTGRDFQQKVLSVFGASKVSERIVAANGYDRIIMDFSGVATTERMPGARIIPVGQNRSRLASAVGKVFGVQVGKSLHPAVVTDRSTERGLHVTYLADARDSLNPAKPTLTDFQKALLRKIAALQSSRVGTHAADGQGVGGEFGHQQLGIAGVLKPSLLQGAHAVHGWADSSQGVAGAVTSPNVATIYDVALLEGNRAVREVSAVLASGVLIDHPAFHEVEDFSLDSTPQEFAAGLGVIAVGSQLGIGQVNDRLMENLQRL